MHLCPGRFVRRRIVLTVLGLSLVAATVTSCSYGDSDDAGSDDDTAQLESVAADPFYDVPDPLPPGAPGDLLRSQNVRAPDGMRAWRVLYHSQRPDGTDIAVSGIVVAPDAAPTAPAVPGVPAIPGIPVAAPVAGAAAAPGSSAGRPVVTFGHGTTGINDRCAPSRSDPPFAGIGGTLGLVQAGYVVAATDYPGLGTPGDHPIYVAVDAGRAVLDAARAAHQITDARAGTDVVAWGYSQGGQAAMAAGTIAASYAPDLTLRGVVASAPLADLSRSLDHMRSNPDGVAYLLLAAAGLAASDPTVDLGGILTPTGRRLMLVAERNCALALTQASAGESIESLFTVNPLVTEPFATGFARQREAVVGPMPPVLVLQGDLDLLIDRPITDAVVTSLCDSRTTVDYRRYPDADHGSILTASMNDLQTWMGERFEGRLPRNFCGI